MPRIVYLRFLCDTSFDKIPKGRVFIDPISCTQFDFFVRIYFSNEYIIAVCICVANFFITFKNFYASLFPTRVEKNEDETFTVNEFVKIVQSKFFDVWTVGSENQVNEDSKSKMSSHLLMLLAISWSDITYCGGVRRNPVQQVLLWQNYVKLEVENLQKVFLNYREYT